MPQRDPHSITTPDTDAPPGTYALLVHGLGPQDGAAAAIARALRAESVAVVEVALAAAVAVDYATRAVLDAAAALAAAGTPPALLVGHGTGGAAVLAAAAGVEGVRAVATLAAPAALDAATGRSGAALLVMHSPHDEVVDIANAARIYGAARHPKSFVSLDDADHRLSDPRAAAHAARMLAAWAAHYLPAPPPVGAPGEVVSLTERGGYRTVVRAGAHGFVADEPRALGGDDTGPTPFDLLLGALGACTGITLKMYAGRKGWPLEEVGVRLRRSRPAAAEGAPAPRREVVHCEIEVRGALDAAQHARLLEIAGRCPVHRLLTAGVDIETRLADTGADQGVVR